MIFTCTELLETRRQIVNIIFKSIIINSPSVQLNLDVPSVHWVPIFLLNFLPGKRWQKNLKKILKYFLKIKNQVPLST